MTDHDLLLRYIEGGDEAAFRDLVAGHIPTVYGVALRRTNGDRPLAEDITQDVFVTLARSARALQGHTHLSGWLYVTARHAAATAMRSEQRRRNREVEALVMTNPNGPSGGADWTKLSPEIDELLDGLPHRDREVLILRFFRGLPLREVGGAVGLSENAARMRIDRAMEKLRGLLSRRGVTSSAAALALTLAGQATAATVPAGLAASVASAACAAGIAARQTGIAAKMALSMSTTKTIATIASAVATLAIGTVIYQSNARHKLIAELAQERDARAALSAAVAANSAALEQARSVAKGLQRSLDEARSQTRPRPGAPPPGSAGSQIDFVLKHPEFREAYLQQAGMEAKRLYASFFAKAHLSAAQEEGIAKMASDLANNTLDLVEVINSQGLTGRDAQAFANSQYQQQSDAAQARLRGVLGDQLYADYQAYTATLPERATTDQVASRTYFTDTPLRAEQADSLVALLAQSGVGPGSGAPPAAATMAGIPVDAQMYATFKAQVASQPVGQKTALVTDQVRQQAAGFLSPAQLSALHDLQSLQMVLLQLSPRKAPGR